MKEEGRMDASVAFAKNIASTRYKDLTPAAVANAKKSTLDTLGAAMVATALEGKVRELAEFVYKGGGKKESTIFGIGGKTSAWMAAFANGALAHASDFDDIYLAGNLHAAPSVIPAAFATAERVGGVNGKQFITAVALGQDVICRLGYAVTHTERGAWTKWALSQTLGYFSAAAAAGKILGLDAEQMTNAFGLSLFQACGTVETYFASPSHTRQIYGTLPAMGGVLAALMAQMGILASKNSLEGRSGLFQSYFEGYYKPDFLTDNLGKRFAGVELGYKAWPCCSCLHTFIDGTLSLMRENNITSKDIDQITVIVADNGSPDCEPVIACKPLEFRRKPPTSVDAKLSTPWAVAVAAAKGKVLVGDFTIDGIKDKAALAMAQRVVAKFDRKLASGPDYDSIGTGITEIRTKAGKVYSKRINKPLGLTAENPLSVDDIVAKFRDCASYSIKPLSKKKVDQIIDIVKNLEDVDDVSRVMKLLG